MVRVTFAGSPMVAEMDAADLATLIGQLGPEGLTVETVCETEAVECRPAAEPAEPAEPVATGG